MRERIEDAKRRMEGATKNLANEFAALRTGRASTALLDRISVDAYGAATPLPQLAKIHAPEARLITVQPFDKTMIQDIEKAIMESDLGLTPSNDGNTIRLPLPQLTEERRKELVKVAHRMAEEARVSVRNVRRDVLNEFKRGEKDGDVSKNDLGRAQDDVQKDELIRTEFGGKAEITRFKGLGEMQSVHLRETTMDPTRRVLLKVGVPNAGGDADERREGMETRTLVEDLMGRKPEKRYDFIQKNAKFARDLDV